MVHKINSVSILTSTKNIFKCLFMMVLSGVKFKVKSLKDSQTPVLGISATKLVTIFANY